MSRHRGRRRPFAARRYFWPTHCACRRYHGFVWSIFDGHVARTVAPR